MACLDVTAFAHRSDFGGYEERQEWCQVFVMLDRPGLLPQQWMVWDDVRWWAYVDGVWVLNVELAVGCW